MKDEFKNLLEKGPVAVNIGVEDFAASLKLQGAEVVEVSWAPPAGGDPELIDLLDQIL
jgi:hypothetical protein